MPNLIKLYTRHGAIKCKHGIAVSLSIHGIMYDFFSMQNMRIAPLNN